MFDDPHAWPLGREGEAVIRTWLLKHRLGVIRLADIESGGAPSLETDARKIVLPDFQIANGATRLCELKTKSHATYHERTHTWEHGLELRLWNQYRACEQQTGLELWLCVFELDTRLVLLADTAHLGPFARRYTGPNMPNGAPFIFFPRDEFEFYPGPSAAIAAAVLEPRAVRTQRQALAPLAPGARQLDLYRGGGQS